MREDRLAAAPVSVARVRHNVLDEAVGPAAAREIGCDGQCTARNERVVDESPKNSVVLIRQDLLPGRQNNCIIGERIIVPVQVLVERNEIAEITRFKLSDHHAHDFWR